MKNIDEILNTYVEAYAQLIEIIEKKANGDWAKLSFLIENNDEKVIELIDNMHNCLIAFRESTSLGTPIHISSPEFDFIYEHMKKRIPEIDSEFSVSWHFNEAMDMIEGILDTGKEDRRWKALDYLSKLPNFSPDDWVRRKYMIQSVNLSTQTKKIPPYLVQRFAETCYSFIYGNFLASVALARATIEMALKERYSILEKLDINEIINKKWFEVKGLKGNEEERKMAESIRTAGNQIMHKSEDKVILIYNEFATRSVLQKLKLLIEFLYD